MHGREDIWVAFPITQEKEMCRPRERIRKRWFFFIVRGFFLGSAPSGRLYQSATGNRNLVNIRHGQARFLFMRINITIGGEHP